MNNLENIKIKNSCLLLIRNSLTQGNESFKQILSKSVHNPNQTFDYLINLMYNTCIKKITSKHVEKVINNNLDIKTRKYIKHSIRRVIRNYRYRYFEW